jgi:hypothetical protein
MRAACAPVRPLPERIREYFSNADLVRKLAHIDKAKPGRMNKKYIGSKSMAVGTSPEVYADIPNSHYSCDDPGDPGVRTHAPKAPLPIPAGLTGRG